MRHHLAFIGASLLLAGTASAATYNVPADFPTIEEAISFASAGDTVLVAPGEYDQFNNGNGGKNIVIQATDGPAVTTINGLTTLYSSDEQGMSLIGFTLDGGEGSALQIIDSNGEWLHIESCRFVNTHDNVVVAWNDYSNITFLNCTFSGVATNPTPGDGLLILNTYNNIIIDECVFENKYRGLSISATTDSIYITNSTFRTNLNNGIWLSSTQQAVLDNCTFTDNGDGKSNGGAIFSYVSGGENLEISNSTFTGNQGTDGGALHIREIDSMIGCTFTNNAASNKGGAIYSFGDYQDFYVSSTTFTNCNAQNGGAVYLENKDADVLFHDCDFVHNSSESGSGVRLQQCNGCTFDICRFEGNTANFYGAAIQLLASTASVNNSTFCENTPDDIYGDGWTDNGNSFAQWCNGDCNENGVPDGQELKEGTATDCDGNDRLDECDIAEDPSLDCDGNGELDSCQVADDPNLDCTGDGLIDACQDLPDCNGNGAPDSCDIADGTSVDLNGDGVPDECKPDCNGNGIPDYIDIIFEVSLDCDTNGVPDECQSDDCDGNGIPDSCDIADGTYEDVDGNGVPDVCQEDCNANGLPDDYEILEGLVDDCNDNGVPDSCDIDSGAATDCDLDGILDDCQYADDPDADCNDNGVYDVCDIADGTSNDWDASGVPDECECLSDITGDLLVNVTDLLNIIGEWNNTNSFADINRDGIVNVEDLLLVIGSWGPCP